MIHSYEKHIHFVSYFDTYAATIGFRVFMSIGEVNKNEQLLLLTNQKRGLVLLLAPANDSTEIASKSNCSFLFTSTIVT